MEATTYILEVRSTIYQYIIHYVGISIYSECSCGFKGDDRIYFIGVLPGDCWRLLEIVCRTGAVWGTSGPRRRSLRDLGLRVSHVLSGDGPGPLYCGPWAVGRVPLTLSMRVVF